MRTTPLDQSQAHSQLEKPVRAGDHARLMSDLTEGQRLLRLLKEKRYDQKDLADAIGITKQAAGQWMKQERFSPSVWKKLKVGLEKLRLDPGYVRPTEAKPLVDLTQLVEDWPAANLQALKQILESDDAPRAVLLAYIKGSLRRVP